MSSLTRPCNTHPRVCFHLVKYMGSVKHAEDFFLLTSLVLSTKEAGLFLCPSLPPEISLLSVVIGISTIESVFGGTEQGRKLKEQHCVASVSDGCSSSDCASFLSFNLFILAVHASRTVLLYSNCILSIIKACFPWLLWCWNGTRGAIHIRPEVPSLQSHTHFCANSRIPIYILAVDLNYCKHLCGPARHNRSAGSCIVSVPPTGVEYNCTTVLLHSWHRGLLQTLECFILLGFIAELLEHLLNESPMTQTASECATKREWIQITSTSLLISCSHCYVKN